MNSLAYSSFKFCCSLFNNAINNSGYMVGQQWRTNRKSYHRKWVWHRL